MNFKISQWDNAKQTHARNRTDIKIQEFSQLAELFANPVPVENKVDQKLITRQWQESRSRENEVVDNKWLITLDYDSVKDEPGEVSKKLMTLKINHFIFTTWTHKTIETPQKKNNGLNCFKVMLEVTAENPEELLALTRSLADKTGKPEVKRVDDISSGIFLGGVHPDFLDDFVFIYFNEGRDVDWTKNYLIKSSPKIEELKQDPLSDFEQWDLTAGQKFTPDRIKRALSLIKYEEVENFSKMSIWYSIGYALHSAKDAKGAEDVDLFEIWDEWCLDNCAEHGVYSREENENFWAKQTAPEKYKELCTLSTLWLLEKVFKAKQATSEIRKSSWTFFDTLAESEPEEVKFIIKDLLVEKSIGFLVGTGGVGKSSLCLEVAKAISSGEDFFGDKRYPTIQGTVAVINKEDSVNKVHNQIHNMIALDIEREGRGGPIEDFSDDTVINMTPEKEKQIKKRWENVARPQWSQSNIRLTDGEGEDLEALSAIIGSLKSLKEELFEQDKPELSLVIIDPLNLWHGGDQNSQKDMSYIFSALQQVQRDLDVCVLIVHHKNKSNGFSGSHTIRDSGRYMWYLQNKLIDKQENPDFIELYIEKNNDAKANYIALDFIRTEKGLLDTYEGEIKKGLEE